MMGIGDLVKDQWQICLAAVLEGVGLCFFYDLFRVIRRLIPHNLRVVMVEDFCFWTIWALAVMTMLDAMDRGVVRMFSLGAVFLGMGLYLLCFSRFVLGALVFVLKRVLGILGRILGVLLRPWKKMTACIAAAVRYNRDKRKEKRRLKHAEKKSGHRKQKQEKEESHRQDRHR